MIYADKLHVKRVLLNMLFNVQNNIFDRQEKDSFPGFIEILIDNCSNEDQPHLDRIKDYLKISKTDNGAGISEELINQIFTPYFSTRIETSNSGLSLAVSQGIIQSHQEYIKVDSEPDNGACFAIYLPRYSREQEK